jgi:hypothetical protein
MGFEDKGNQDVPVPKLAEKVGKVLYWILLGVFIAFRIIKVTQQNQDFWVIIGFLPFQDDYSLFGNMIPEIVGFYFLLDWMRQELVQPIYDVFERTKMIQNLYFARNMKSKTTISAFKNPLPKDIDFIPFKVSFINIFRACMCLPLRKHK